MFTACYRQNVYVSFKLVLRFRRVNVETNEVTSGIVDKLSGLQQGPMAVS